jgi:hypothetical protein
MRVGAVGRRFRVPFDADGRQDDDGRVLALSAGSRVPQVPETIGELNDRAHVASLDASARPATRNTLPAGSAKVRNRTLCGLRSYPINAMQG